MSMHTSDTNRRPSALTSMLTGRGLSRVWTFKLHGVPVTRSSFRIGEGWVPQEYVNGAWVPIRAPFRRAASVSHDYAWRRALEIRNTRKPEPEGTPQ